MHVMFSPQSKMIQCLRRYRVASPAQLLSIPTVKQNDILEELQARGIQVKKSVDQKQYELIKRDLNDSFIVSQLKTYLRHNRLSPTGSKSALIESILALWKVEIINDDVQTVQLATTNRDLFFMFGQDGTMMRNWARQCSAKVEIDAYASTLKITATRTNLNRFQTRMEQALGSIRTAIIPWHCDEVRSRQIMSVIRAFIERVDDGTRVSWLGARDDPLHEAQRYILASMQTATPVVYTAHTDAHDQDIIDRDLPFFQADKTWKRLTGGRSKLSIEYPVGNTTLGKIITHPVHVGYALHNKEWCFSGNAARLHSLLKTLTPKEHPQRKFTRLIFVSDNQRLVIDTSDQYTATIEDEQIIIQLPDHPVDLMMQPASTIKDDRIDAFLQQCTFTKIRIPPVLQLDKCWYFLKALVVDTLYFEEGVEYSFIQGGTLGGRSTDLKITSRVCELLNRIV